MTPHFDAFSGPHGRIAYQRRQGPDNGKPGIAWLGGFRSDMTGAKASFLDAWAEANNRTFLRFDYSGHGASEGAFEDGAIGVWKDDALAVFDGLTSGPQILVGSSMGGWIASLIALARPERVSALVLIAPAPDFTERLMWPSFSPAQRQTLESNGQLELPSDYTEEPEVITLRLIEDGRRHSIMNALVPISCPVRILQGMKDESVPFEHALSFARLIESEDVEITLTPHGDHRLSAPADLSRLTGILDRL